MSEEADGNKEKLMELLKKVPDLKRYADRLRRLWSLAKQAPLASANEDFLEVMDQNISKMEGEVKLAEIVAEVMNK